VPTPCPKEFRRDVVAVARQGDQSMAKVAQSFGISASCLARWLRVADREDGSDAAPKTADEVEVRELRRRNKQLEQRTRFCVEQRPTSPATCSQNDVPAGPRTGC
jgi:transposase-like protein